MHDRDRNYDKAFKELKTAITQAPILIAPDWQKPFLGQVDASQFAVIGMLNQMDVNGRKKVVAFFLKKLSSTERYYTAIDLELVALMRFLERSECYIKGFSFEIITFNLLLKHFFTKPKLTRRKLDNQDAS